LSIDGVKLGAWLLLLFASPVLFWGGCHVVALFADLIRQLRSWWLPALPIATEVRAAVITMKSTSFIFPPMLRLDASSRISAYTAIAPFPFLPPVITLSRGALEKLPPRCQIALIAHEIGHLRRGHAQLYSWLRLLSRLLFLGPSFLTGLIKSPLILEAQADAFAVQWLESVGASRQDLMDALRLMEAQNLASLMSEVRHHHLGAGESAAADWLSPKLRRSLEFEKNASLPRRFFIRWQLLHYMTFHSDLANYTYSFLADRLKTIAALPYQKRPT